MTKGTFGQLTCEWQYTYDEFTKEPFIVDGRRLRIEAKVCFVFILSKGAWFLIYLRSLERVAEIWHGETPQTSDCSKQNGDVVLADEIIWALGIFCWYASVCGVSIAWKMVIQRNSFRRLQSIFITNSVEIGQNVDVDLVAIPEIQMYQSNTFSSAMLLGFLLFASNQILQKYYKVLISS